MGLLALKPPEPVISASPLLVCFSAGERVSLVAQQGGRVSAPLLTWPRVNISPDYSSAQSCDGVSQKLNQAITDNQGQLTGIQLTSGQIQGIPVLCYTTPENRRCTAKTVLVTLRLADRGQEQQVLQQMLNPRGLTTANAPTAPVILSERVDQALAEQASPSPRSTPSPSPSPDTTAPIPGGI